MYCSLKVDMETNYHLHDVYQGVIGLDVMVELGLHLGRRAFPVDGGMIFTTDICVYEIVSSWCAEEGYCQKERR